MLIGNKNDLIERRAVRREKAQEYANSHGLPYLETSARSGSNVSEMFVDPARQLIADIESKRLIVSGNESMGIKIGNPELLNAEKNAIQISIATRQQQSCKC